MSPSGTLHSCFFVSDNFEIGLLLHREKKMAATLRPAADYYHETVYDEHGMFPGGLFLPLKETSLTFCVTQSRVRQWQTETWWKERFRTREGFNVIAILFARWRHARAGGRDPFEAVKFELVDDYETKGTFA
jgi:hypothetical protein